MRPPLLCRLMQTAERPCNETTSWTRNVRSLLGFVGSRHCRLDLGGCMGKRGGEIYQFAAGVDPYNVLNPDANFFFGNIDARFDGKHRPAGDRRRPVADVVYFQSYIMADAVDEVLPQRLTVQVFAVGIDVIISDFEQGIGATARQGALSGPEGSHHSPLRAQNDVINLALAIGELAIRGRCPGGG